MTAADVIAGRIPWSVEQSDALEFLRSLPDDSIDLLVTSPPYLEARTYGIGAGRKLEDWVKWMAEIVAVASKKVTGLIAINCEGQTRDYRYLPAPFLLMTDLHRSGFNLRKPPVFHRVGIPGSGGPDWLRNDYEPIVCITRPGRLPWSDNTAMGRPPKWAPGGEMSYQTTEGRVNGWNPSGKPKGGRRPNGTLRSTEAVTPHCAKVKPTNFRAAPDGTVKGGHKREIPASKKMYSRNPDGERDEDEAYAPPVLANPGNVLSLKVGGGMMGHPCAHDNEAPFPLELPAFFVKSFCPPTGIVCDPFTGSGTTLHAAHEHGRRFIGCDLRQSQVDLAKRRIRTVTPSLLPA